MLGKFTLSPLAGGEEEEREEVVIEERAIRSKGVCMKVERVSERLLDTDFFRGVKIGETFNNNNNQMEGVIWRQESKEVVAGMINIMVME